MHSGVYPTMHHLESVKKKNKVWKLRYIKKLASLNAKSKQ